MGLLILLQVVLDLGFIATATWLLIDRSKSKSMEDPRLSRGLQLLSSKIAILQDLMDSSETMSKQLTQLIEGKQADIQERIEEVEIFLHKIQTATEKSEKVVEIFQDRVPHKEMIERQTTVRYQQAARLANQGLSFETIAQQVDIPRGELELIVKVNRDRLVKEESYVADPTPSDQGQAVPTFGAVTAAAPHAHASTTPIPTHPVSPAGPTVPSFGAMTAAAIAPVPGKGAGKEIKPFVFKRISVTDDLG